MNPVSLIAAATILCAAGAAVLLLVVLAVDRLVGRKPICIDSLIVRGLPFVVVITVGLMVIQALYRPYSLWDDPRLAMTMAIFHGHRLYPPPGDGPQLTTIYGPVGPIMYLPAMIASRPDVAMVIAGVLAQIYFFAPVALVCFRRQAAPADRAGLRPRGMPSLLSCLAVLICASSQSLAYSGFQIHVDAPALGFAGLACVAACRACSQDRGRFEFLVWMTGVGVLAALAVFTKQTLLPLLPALVIGVGMRRGLPAAAGLSAILVAAVVATLGVLGGLFGFREMAFHAVAVPMAHPRDKSLLSIVPWAAGECLPLLSLPLALISCRIALRTGRPGESPRLPGSPAAPWFLFLLTACLCVPTAALAFAKRGGAVNNWSLITYFLLLAVLDFTTECLQDGHEAVRSVSRALVLSAALCLSLAAALSDLPKRGMVMRAPSPTARVFEYCRLHPGEVYFPWHPAAVFAAEGRLDHFYYAVYDRTLARRPITSDHRAAFEPAAHRYMCFDRDGVLDERFFEEFVTGYDRRDDLFGLADTIDGMVFERRE